MKYLITFSYNGNYFKGYQKQKNLKTVQGCLEKYLTMLNDNEVVVTSSGRTDVYVHAINAKAHFTLDKNIKEYNIKTFLNRRLNGEIYIKDVVKVDDNFHARYDVVKKEYRYYINMGKFNPIEKDYVYQYNKKLDINKMKKASKLFIGEHDFRAFCSNEKEKINCIRNIYKIKIIKHNDKLELIFVGNGFLKHMVRNIVGILLKVGSNLLTVYEVETILEEKTRKHNTKPVPGNGLYLWNVYYK